MCPLAMSEISGEVLAIVQDAEAAPDQDEEQHQERAQHDLRPGAVRRANP